MQLAQGDPPIRRAEIHGDNSSPGSTGESAASDKTQPPALPPRTSDGGPKKRARTQAPEAPEQESEKRRARGRPRLDTRDETAADRRRTQIRLAQRAYRDRKENTIQSLEKSVQSLKKANEEMSNAFLQLHDFALSCGLLDKAPQFGRQLRETTERFLSLAREASDDAKDGGPRAGADSDQSVGRPSSDLARSVSPGQSQNTATTSAGVSEGAEEPETLSSGQTPDPTSQAGCTTASPVPVPPEHQAQPPSLSALGFDATFDPPREDTSFPLPSNPAFTLDSLFAPSPFLSLPPPSTYTAFEATFGRRLQRYALEQALILLTMPHPPRYFIERVFGFCMLLESPTTIVRRLRRLLSRDSRHSLYNWQYPFYHLGGAGTHFGGVPPPPQQSQSQSPSQSPSPSPSQPQPQPPPPAAPAARRMGNQGTLDVDRPRATAGFATGPFSERVGAVRDRDVDCDMRIALPGYAGEYFDCDEAEVYLFRRGVVIPPGSEVLTLELDAADVARYTGRGGGVGGGGADAGVGEGHAPDAAGWQARTVDTFDESALSSGPTSAGSDGGAGTVVDPALAGLLSRSQILGGAPAGEAPATVYTSSPGGGDALAFGMAVPGAAGGAGYGVGARRKITVTVDVMALVNEMTDRSICLGRTPGFKPSDIDAAFWAAVEAGLD